ncbi:hypothetical protein HW115_16665 [Verrucomicrobiaceae bacterium N1E253]|uniref:Uncharacterized protein n=1 Tax=Oceaniferula marina TaxID=2748318 RepID=A0A851GQI7_9BACT|nr:hypothetical protein [Oceaniferula marina]NWK57257.1 hypothetical protein [Oceaniferula marina]
MFRCLIILGLSFAISGGWLLAQEKEKLLAVTLWDSPGDGKSFYWRSDQDSELKGIELAPMKRSKPLSTEASELHFYIKQDGEPRKLGTVKLADAPDHALVILKLEDEVKQEDEEKPEEGETQDEEVTPEEEVKQDEEPQQSGCEIVVIPDNPKDLPYGSYYFYNHSELPLDGKLGEEEFRLEPGKGIHVAPDAKNGEALSFELAYEKEGKKKFLVRNTFHYKTKKYLVLLFDEETSSSGRVRLESKGLVAFQPDEEEQEVDPES